MVQSPSVFSEKHVAQQLALVLGQTLSDADLSDCFQAIEFLELSVGKAFWQSTQAAPGIYIILEGKVRLLHPNDDLIASLGVGESFGELTLFPEANFQAYGARASLNLKLAFLPSACLQSLTHRYPAIQKHLYQQAQRWDEQLTEPVEERDGRRVESGNGQPFQAKPAVEYILPSSTRSQKRPQKAYFPSPQVKAGQWWQHIV